MDRHRYGRMGNWRSIGDQHPRLLATCWAHGRRPFFIFADVEEAARRKATGDKPIVLSPIAIEIVRRIDALFEIEREINGLPPGERRAVRQARSKPLVDQLRAYMEDKRKTLSPKHDLAYVCGQLADE